MARVTAIVRALLLAAAVASPGAAQDHPHPPADGLGTVRFETSCDPSVAPQFDRAVALLHSFEFGAALRAFDAVQRADSTCAMAHWGIALARWSNPMSAGNRAPAQLADGRRAVDAARRLAARASERERGYVAAVSQLYADADRRSQGERVLAYERAMAALAAANPSDDEAKIFHAIALVQAASPTDKTYANQLRAGATLERLFAASPDHPGLAHYIIHSYDVPALASRAADAARRYANIAPSAAHALHMPSHTFTRVGMWDESIATNLRSMDAALRMSCLAEALHAADYAVYANMQLRRDSAVRVILRQLPPIAARFDPTAVCGAAPGSAGLFALAAMPARYALERRAWAEAAALETRTTAFPFADAVTWFARALGAARLGDTSTVRAARDSLSAMHARLVASGETYWAEQVAIQHVGADAWFLFASNRREDAVARMREAASREDLTEKPAVSPGPLAPARELLADMLAAMGRSAEARGEYQAALKREPGRYWSRVGAGAGGSP